VDLAAESMDVTSETIKEELQKKNVNVSSRTVQRRLNEAGFKYMKPLSKPLLTEEHQQRRLQWAREMENQDWSQIMATDETIIRLNMIRKFSWQRPGERKIFRTVNKSLKVNVWECLSEHGFGRIYCFTNNLNSEFLCNHIYRDALIPSARQHFGGLPWLLLEDNDPKHRSKYTSDWKIAHHITTLPWASMGPDMNPVENLWAIPPNEQHKKTNSSSNRFIW
jgi:hypothetical protein